MSFKKVTYASLAGLMLFTGCTDTSKKEEVIPEVKKEVVVKKPVVKQMSVAQKKKRFKDILVPIATDVYNELETQYINIKNDIKNNTNKKVIAKLKKEYKAKSDEQLLQALKPHPISILLAQAAAESAWLTSRFTRDANNIFGVWSFNKKEPRIAASGLRGSKTIYLKKYSTIKDAVRDYYKNLGKNWAYKEFRKQRTLTSNPYVLSDHLTSYSEKKGEYTKLLRSMIKYNKFDQYDIKSDIEYTQYIAKKPKVKKEPIKELIKESNTTVVIDTNATLQKVILVKEGNETNTSESTSLIINETNEINATIKKEVN